MMSRTQQQISDEAIAWAIRLRGASAADWEEFTSWLEADPANLDAYEEVCAADELAEGLPPAPEPARAAVEPVREARPARRRTMLAWAAAAAVAGVIGYSSLPGPSDLYAVETAAGEQRRIALDDGSSIHLNGGSRLTLDRESPRFARLERGEALFTVVHSDSDPFRVEAGEARIEDLGTVFNVSRDGDAVSVGVAEGAVALSSDKQRVALSAGMAARASGGAIVPLRQDAGTVGSWQRGVLSYSSAPLSEVALDLTRSAGLRLALSPELKDHRFSGTIILDGDRETLRRRVPALLGVEIRPAGEGWLLVPAER